MPKTRVLRAEDHTVVAEGFEALLKDTFDLLGTVQDGRAPGCGGAKPGADVIVADTSGSGSRTSEWWS